MVPVEHAPAVSVGFTWGAAAGWATFVAISGTIAAILRAIGLSKIVELILTRSKDLRTEKRADDVADAARADLAEKRALSAESRVVYLSGAVTLLLGAVEELAVDNPSLLSTVRQARELVAMAADTDDAFGRALRKLAAHPPVEGGK